MEIKALVANSSNNERKNIIRSLNEIGVRDIAAPSDTMQAIQLVQQSKFDVVFADFNTQTGEWKELVKAVRKIDGKLPIIVTAPRSKKIDDLKKAYPNVSDYLMVPFTTEQLRKTVSEYVPSLAV